jgi:hypothetical protein
MPQTKSQPIAKWLLIHLKSLLMVFSVVIAMAFLPLPFTTLSADEVPPLGNTAQLRQGLQAYANKNYPLAWRHLFPLAKQGDREAQRRIGIMYRHGLGVARNDLEALKWYRKAAEQGHVKAQNSLGIMYRFGMGVAKDPGEGAKWLLAAARQGYAKSQENIGLVYLDGDGVEQNDELAAKWLKQAALQGQVRAQLTFGLLSLAGRGVAQNQTEGMQWIERAATQGSQQAAMALAKAYEQGLYGKEKDLHQAKVWYQRAGQPVR